MSLSITSLASGSNGNCYYIANEREAVLVDAGISCRETERRMSRLGLSMQKVKAIFISHEHSDHIRGLPVLAAKYSLPVYISSGTLRHCPFHLNRQFVYSFTAGLPVSIGELSVTPFIKFHDAAEPHSFMVSGNGVNVGVFTDIGGPCQQLSYYFRQCHAAFLEANYDEDLLEKGRYPIYLKNRIRGGQGHLSNKQALAFFIHHQPSFMSRLILSHLSGENNCPELVHRLFTQSVKGTEISVASRFKETPVYTITSVAKEAKRMRMPAAPPRPEQLSLF